MGSSSKIALVTGAGTGIGRSVALALAQNGYAVVLAGRHRETLEKTAREAEQANSQTLVAPADVTDPNSVRELFAKTKSAFGRLDLLFNNAGISGVGDVLETEPDLFDRVMRVNVRGVYLMSRAVVPHMIKQGSGSIINMSSCIADIGLARRVSYAASKGAVLSMTKSMQVDVAQHGIRVNALLPGTILTPFVERYLKESYKDPEEGFASIRKRQLTSELGRPEDVASAALYLASDESRFVMASGLVVDGGVTGAK